jgi:predicted transcriptional regulator
MTRNVTLRMDEELLRKVRHQAVDRDLSLSAWVVAVLEQAVRRGEARDEARRRALRRLAKGYHLGGRPLGREQAHAR